MSASSSDYARPARWVAAIAISVTLAGCLAADVEPNPTTEPPIRGRDGGTLDGGPGSADGGPNTTDGGPGSTDLDADGVENAKDNCPNSKNPLQSDLDTDGAGDPCDSDFEAQVLLIIES